MSCFVSFFRNSMQRRLRAYFILWMIVPLIATGLIFYHVSVSRIFELSLQSSRQIIGKTVVAIDSLLNEAIRLPALINADPDIQAMSDRNYTSRERFVEDTRMGDQKLHSLNQYRSDIFGIYVLMDNGMQLKSRYFAWDVGDFLQSDTFNRAHTNYYNVWITSANHSLAVQNAGQSVIALCAQVRSAVTDQPRGVTVIEIQHYWLEQALRMQPEAGVLLLLNEQNELIAAGKQGLSEQSIKSYLAVTGKSAIGREPVLIDQSDCVFICQRLEQSNWIVAGVIPKPYLNQSGRMLTLTILAVFGLFLIVSLPVSRRAVGYELRPITHLADGIRRLEKGGFDITLPVERGDEVGNLTASFNTMTVRLHTLVAQNAEKQEHLHKAEFRALQAQIKPHFLYNTLDSISGLARMGRAAEAVRLVDALTVFFKTSLSGGRDIITLSEEMKHTESYLAIQKIRYADIFSYQINMVPSAVDCAVPKLTLQPLVENALYHGIKPCAHRCLLQINVLDYQDSIQIEIIDNGVGMSARQLTDLRASLAPDATLSSEGFGVRNVDERIRALMGKSYGLRFESEPGFGTAVIVRIQKTQGGQTNV